MKTDFDKVIANEPAFLELEQATSTYGKLAYKVVEAVLEDLSRKGNLTRDQVFDKNGAEAWLFKNENEEYIFSLPHIARHLGKSPEELRTGILRVVNEEHPG